jgi:two-component system, NtrC family, response regulator HydG
MTQTLSQHRIQVLLADDDQGLRLSVKTTLEASGHFAVTEAFDGIKALEVLKTQNFDVALLDVDMPRLNGLETLKKIKEHNPGIVVLMLTAFASIEHAVQAVKDGAYQYLAKPVQGAELISLVNRAVSANSLISNIAASSPVLMEEGKKFIGSTQQMQKVFSMIHRVSKVDTPVLIRGASGTGKELVAKAVHFNSHRKEGKLVSINCSSIPENLFESELFGHEKGSFTGADQRKIGKFQFAEGGTLFLDEVGDLPQLMQVKLLRVLQEKVFTPVGANREIATNVRIIAATNRPLEEMMKTGAFREDLFYRLNVIPLFLPSLVDRKQDLDSLIVNFVRKFNQTHGKRVTGLSADAVAVLKRYDWPGNIRELENFIEHAFVMESGSVIGVASLPESLLKATGTDLGSNDLHRPRLSEIDESESDQEIETDLESTGDEELLTVDAELSSGLDFNLQKEAFEKEFIIKALTMFKGRINQTALHANIPKKTLLRKIEKYGIVAKDYST